jgi:hypothetical protein
MLSIDEVKEFPKYKNSGKKSFRSGQTAAKNYAKESISGQCD